MDPKPKKNYISLKEIEKHNNSKDCWIIIAQRVLDITNFIEDHPGGNEILLEYAGKDATNAFIEIGHLSNFSIIQMLNEFIIGYVDESINSKI